MLDNFIKLLVSCLIILKLSNFKMFYNVNFKPLTHTMQKFCTHILCHSKKKTNKNFIIK